MYAGPGDYTVSILGEMTGFGFGRVGYGGDPDPTKSRKKLVDIQNWGCVRLGDDGHQFFQCSNLGQVSARDVPDLRGVTNMNGMFRGASSFQSDLSQWDVSQVTNMAYMFYGASSFQSDLSQWDVSQVTDMAHMFNGASSFQRDLSPRKRR